jgi:hypothetical protein
MKIAIIVEGQTERLDARRAEVFRTQGSAEHLTFTFRGRSVAVKMMLPHFLFSRGRGSW